VFSVGQFIAASKTIVSIYPIEPEALERMVGPTQRSGRTLFTIPASPKGEYRFLEVPDMFRLERDWNFSDREPDAWKPMLQPAEQTVEDLVGSWTNCLIGARESGGRPGIAVYDGDIDPKWPAQIEKVNDPKFRNFIRNLVTAQDAFFTFLFYDGQKLAQQNEWKSITSLHRTAAEWLGKQALWIKPETSESHKDCPACFTKVDSRAFICPNCRTQIAPKPAEFAKFDATQPVRPPVKPQ
jgi:hypothetical protein